MSEDVFSVLKKKIRNQMNDLADHLAVGSAKDMEEYRKITGIIEGLAWAEREVIDLEDKLLKLQFVGRNAQTGRNNKTRGKYGDTRKRNRKSCY